MSSAYSAALISQKKFLKDLRTLQFHLRCLEDARVGAYNDGEQEFTYIGMLTDKIGAYCKMSSLDEDSEKMDLALQECTMLELASTYVTYLQLEYVNTALKSARLTDENEWHIKENKIFKSRIQNLQEKIAGADQDMQRYLLLCQIRQSDMTKGDLVMVSNSVEGNLAIDNNILSVLSVSLKAFYPLALKYVNAGRYDPATSLCKKSQNGKLSNADQALIEYILGESTLRQRQAEESCKHFENALALMSKAQGAEHICLVPLLRGHGKALRLLQNYEEAIGQFKKALTIKMTADNAEGPVTWAIRTDVASCWLKLGKVDEASNLLIACLEQASKVLHACDNIVLLMKNYIARCYLQLKQEKEAMMIIKVLLAEAFTHEGYPAISEVLRHPDTYQVSDGESLVGVCQQTNSLLELFTYQTLIKIYRITGNEFAADLLDQYVHIHSVHYEIQ
ncbi:unnamed protein product [Dibothriocephalus latus]|uniref:Uncharacterized protein n=1 Tax=Dibothriocephalus latus TaxID=60516 RepID=A0A3P6V7Q1_DIBLA|nr:unnamed protein product [Dibothriocephalus latus]